MSISAQAPHTLKDDKTSVSDLVQLHEQLRASRERVRSIDAKRASLLSERQGLLDVAAERAHATFASVCDFLPISIVARTSADAEPASADAEPVSANAEARSEPGEIRKKRLRPHPIVASTFQPPDASVAQSLRSPSISPHSTTAIFINNDVPLCSQQTLRILDAAINQEAQRFTRPMFSKPVDDQDAPEYYEWIEKPSDLQTLRNSVAALGASETMLWREFDGNMRQIVANTVLYNGPDHIVTRLAYDLYRTTAKAMKASALKPVYVK